MSIEDIRNPCRDDRCRIEGVHAAHSDQAKNRPVCPVCGGELIRLSIKRVEPRTQIYRGQRAQERARCFSCNWRGAVARHAPKLGAP